MIIKDSTGCVGLFYIIDGLLYALTQTLDENFPDELGDIQPSENHEYLLNELKYSGTFQSAKQLREKLGCDLKTADVFTFPRGRVWYNIYDKTFTVSTSTTILNSPHYKSEIINFFELNDKKVKWDHNVEYDNFDESYL